MATTSSRFNQEADRVHACLLDASRREKAAVLEIAYLLADVDSRQLYRKFNRTSVGDYATFFGITRSAGHARDLVNMVRNLEKTPKIRAALENGEMDWTKARTASAAAVAATDDPGSEDRWLKRGREHTNEVLEALAREEQGDKAPIRRLLKLTREEDADVDQVVFTVRAMYGRTLTVEQALAIACRDWARIQAGGGREGQRSSANPANRLVITRCGDCGKAWRETRKGPIEVSSAVLAAHACDAEISDVRDGPARITKTVPPITRRHVLDRDGHRCRVPGCSSMGFLHAHHEGGREVVGHDDELMPALCDHHHRQRHDEPPLLVIRPDAEVGFRFFDSDGTEVTGAPGQVAAVVPRPLLESDARSCERAGPEDGSSSSAPGPASKRRSCERGSSESTQETAGIDEDARRALAGLGLRKRESAKALKSAREALAARREDVTLESLLREALSTLPGPRARDP